jgi:hypothetical protein
MLQSASPVAHLAHTEEILEVRETLIPINEISILSKHDQKNHIIIIRV